MKTDIDNFMLAKHCRYICTCSLLDGTEMHTTRSGYNFDTS